MPIDKRKSKSDIIKELMDKYKRTGKIGTSTPESKEAALKQAEAIAYSSKGESQLNRINNLTKKLLGE